MSKQKRRYTTVKNVILTAILIIAVIACLYIERTYGTSFWFDISKKVKLNSNVTEERDKFYSHFINVGQADCTLLKCNDDVVLIDAGDVDSAFTICQYLDSFGVKEIDYLILTHMHADHIGSAVDILKKYEVKNVILSRLTEGNVPASYLYDELLDELNKCEAKILAANAGDTYSLDSFSFTVLAPCREYSELNNTSVVIKAVYGNLSFLYMGDAEEKSEKDIIKSGADLSADVLKLGHHGSNTSSSNEFLDAVAPQLAVASCGEYNDYGHPSPETQYKLKARNIDLYRTDTCGNIVVVCGKDSFSVVTER